jgi:hypothetical protein
MYGIGEKKYYGELKVFVDENKTPKPLRHLISRIDLIESRSINQFKIVEEEYNLLPDLLKNELIKKENIFTSFILNPKLFQGWDIQFNIEKIEHYVRELSLFFSWKNAESEILQSQWASIPWLYIDDKQRFIESNKIYWSHAFSHLSADKYITISLKNNFITNDCASIITRHHFPPSQSSARHHLHISSECLERITTGLDFLG